MAAFQPRAFANRVAQLVTERPEAAAGIYATAAATIRKAASLPENKPQRLSLLLLGRELDNYAAQSAIPIDHEPVIKTEFDAIAEDVRKSRYNADGSQNDDFTAAALLQQSFHARDREAALPVQTAPVSATEGNTVFGGDALCRYGGSAGSGSFSAATGGVSGALVAKSEEQVIRWDGRDHESMACTVTVRRLNGGAGATYPAIQDGNNVYSYRPYFKVQWGGSRGEPHVAYGDIGRGTQFTLTCNYLYVSVGMDPPDPSTVGLSGAEVFVPGSMVLGASFGFYSSTRQMPIYRTAYVDGVPQPTVSGAPTAANERVIIIPDFAVTLEGFQFRTYNGPVPGAQTTTTWRQPLFTNAEWLMNVEDIKSRVIFQWMNIDTLNYGIMSSFSRVPLPDDAYQLRVIKQTGADPPNNVAQSARVIFGLTF